LISGYAAQQKADGAAEAIPTERTGQYGLIACASVLEGKMPRIRLTAVCDINPERMVYDPEIKTFTDGRALIVSGEVDAVLIATPHLLAYRHWHRRTGIHTLIENRSPCTRPTASVLSPRMRRQAASCLPRCSTSARPFHQKNSSAAAEPRASQPAFLEKPVFGGQAINALFPLASSIGSIGAERKDKRF
jgi:hypothetical protein